MGIEMHLGGHEAAVDRRLAAWHEGGAPDRLWSADHALWTAEPQAEITDRLGWLRLPETMRPALAGLRRFADDVRADGITDIVLLGMGGSSLAPEVFGRTFDRRPGYPALRVLDSTHPAAVTSVAAAVDPQTALFVVASKSGTTIEPLSFFEFFWDLVSTTVTHPGAHFVAITDPGSPLEAVASERGFRRTFTADPDVGGRYSALTHFGLVPAALIGADIDALVDGAAVSAAEARSGASGFPLGAALGELALAGRDKATFLTSPGLGAFPDWAEQLIAESTGKDGVGIIPVAGEDLGPPSAYGADRVFVSLTLVGDDRAALDAGLDDLQSAGHPVVRITVDRPEDLGAEMYRAEIAVAMAGSVLGIHPFNQPDVQASKALAGEAMAGRTGGAGIPETIAGDPDLGTALAGLLEGAGPGGYLAIQAFLAPAPGTAAALRRIRHLVRERHRLATTVGFGPRFLHSTGQLHKGGPATGVFLQIVDHAAPAVAVPGAGYTFAELIAGQADGDHGALTAAGRRVLRVCLGDDVTGGLAAIEEVLR